MFIKEILHEKRGSEKKGGREADEKANLGIGGKSPLEDRVHDDRNKKTPLRGRKKKTQITKCHSRMEKGRAGRIRWGENRSERRPTRKS